MAEPECTKSLKVKNVFYTRYNQGIPPGRKSGRLKPIIANNDKNKYNVWQAVKVKLTCHRGDERWKRE